MRTPEEILSNTGKGVVTAGRSRKDILLASSEFALADMEEEEIDENPEDIESLIEFQDFQKEYGETLGLSRAVSLKAAVMCAGVDFSGKEHDALDDAKNTASLLRIIRIPELCNMALENVIDAFQTKPIGTSLGDLLHFDELGIPA